MYVRRRAGWGPSLQHHPSELCETGSVGLERKSAGSSTTLKYESEIHGRSTVRYSSAILCWNGLIPSSAAYLRGTHSSSLPPLTQTTSTYNYSIVTYHCRRQRCTLRLRSSSRASHLTHLITLNILVTFSQSHSTAISHLMKQAGLAVWEGPAGKEDSGRGDCVTEYLGCAKQRDWYQLS
nr:hypothetical protein CFP56_52878 [Quercus suber]